MCHTDQEKGVRANGVSILTGTTNSRFSRIRSSVMPDPNGIKFTVSMPFTQGGHIQNLKKIPSMIPKIRAIKFLKKFFILFFFSYT